MLYHHPEVVPMLRLTGRVFPSSPLPAPHSDRSVQAGPALTRPGSAHWSWLQSPLFPRPWPAQWSESREQSRRPAQTRLLTSSMLASDELFWSNRAKSVDICLWEWDVEADISQNKLVKWLLNGVSLSLASDESPGKVGHRTLQTVGDPVSDLNARTESPQPQLTINISDLWNRCGGEY